MADNLSAWPPDELPPPTCGVCRREIDVVRESRRVHIEDDESVPEGLRAPEGPLLICDECWDTSIDILKQKRADEN